MKAYIGRCFIGVFAFDENKTLLNYKLFTNNPEDVADKMQSDKLEEEKELVSDLKKAGFNDFDLDKNNLAYTVLKDQMRKLALDLQFVQDQKELNSFLTSVNVALNKRQLKKVKKDKIIMHVIGVIDELDKVTNNFSERLREWYGLHSPEVVKAIPDHEKFAELVSKGGRREKIEDKKVEKIRSFSGMDFSNGDIEAVKEFSGFNFGLYQLRNHLAKYLEDICRETMPNTTAVGGSLLSSRLLQLAGGLDKIARMPSSTIQLLGAEKALFRHMKGQGRAPKYGVIYAHTLVQNAKKEQKGKVARLVAAKLSMATKVDAYSDRNDGEKFRQDLLDQVRNLNKL